MKRAAGPYRAGKRSPEWQKLKIQLQDEFVVGGWTSPRGARRHFGALVLGTANADGTLTYVGDVGTGFPDAELDRLAGLLAALATETCPFDSLPKTVGAAHWVTPRLVAQVRYTEMTDEGRLRHPGVSRAARRQGGAIGARAEEPPHRTSAAHTSRARRGRAGHAACDALAHPPAHERSARRLGT